MRTVRRESLKLNRAKFDALERIARAFAHDKQAHLDFYQYDLNFSEAQSYRLRRNELKGANHHASTPLSVHASDLAVKVAFETEVKYWAAVAADIYPRIASHQWTPEQKHYAFWLLGASQRFSLLILDRAPINEKIRLGVRERKQVQNYLRRRARRIIKARPSVKIARSFALDSTLYVVVKTLTGQGLAISSLEKGKRIFIPLQGEVDISGNIRIVLVPESRKVEAHVSSEVKDRVNASEKVIAADVGLTEVLVDDEGNHYGKELGDTLKKASRRLNEKGKKRNKLQALAKKYDRQGKQVKARNIRRRNLGHKKSQELKRRAKITITNQINRAINELIKKREPKVIVTEKLDFRGKAASKDISRRVSYWRRSTLKDRFEFKASAAGCRREQVNPAYTSQTCPECGYLEKANRKGDVFQCQKCGHRGDADQIAAQNQKSRYYDRRITLYTPKETVKEILLKDYQSRLEHPNASKEKIRKMTVPGQTLEREEAPGTKSSRQSKSKTAAGKKTKSAAMK
jgi:putative transposase